MKGIVEPFISVDKVIDIVINSDVIFDSKKVLNFSEYDKKKITKKDREFAQKVDFEKLKK